MSSGYLNYLDTSAESTLYRNGKIFIPRREDGRDGEMEGCTMTRVLKQVRDCRKLETPLQPRLDRDGYELVSDCAPSAEIDFLNGTDITGRYYEHCEHLVQRHTQARRVYAFDHNVRSTVGSARESQIEKGQRVVSPAAIVHGDYTLTSARERLEQLTRGAGRNDTFAGRVGDSDGLIKAEHIEGVLMRGERFGIVNVWRNIKRDELVLAKPLAMCAVGSVSTKELSVLEIRYADRIGENYLAKHLEQHEWSYFSNMRHDEAILLKTWDSHGTFAKTNGQMSDSDGGDDSLSTFVLHSAVELTDTEKDAPGRWSMEVRCIVIY